MDLRRRTSQALAGAGAILIVGSLSFGGGVALAEPGPAGPSAERDKATTSSSDPKSSKGRKSKGDSDKSKSDGDRTDKTGTATTDTTRGDRSTGTTATSTTATTVPTATTRPTPTTRPTATTATTRPSTTATTSPQTAPQQVEPGTGQSTDTTTAPPNRPAARSGSDLPPGMYPVGPGPKSVGSTPAPTIAAAPNAAVAPPSTPVTVAETQPAEGTTGTTADAGVSDPVVTKWPPDTDVSGTEQERGDSPAPARRSAQLGETGDGTHRLILLGGVAMLLGAVVVAFTGRDRPRPDSADSVPAGPAYRPRPRRELDGWEEGVPLAPAKRELARHRLGISAGYGLPGDGPGA
jgi:hypothetical protein